MATVEGLRLSSLTHSYKYINKFYSRWCRGLPRLSPPEGCSNSRTAGSASCTARNRRIRLNAVHATYTATNIFNSDILSVRWKLNMETNPVLNSHNLNIIWSYSKYSHTDTHAYIYIYIYIYICVCVCVRVYIYEAYYN